MKKIISKILNRFYFWRHFPLYLFLYLLIKKAKKDNRMTILVEFQTTNEFFYLKPVLENLHKEGAFMIFFTRAKVIDFIKELTGQFFSGALPKTLDIFWIHKFGAVDFYINATQSYDIEVPMKAKRKINFPHTITSKGKNDVFSPALEKMTDSFNSGPIYTKDIQTYCAENLKATPQMHDVGCPKSDSLFDHTIDREKFLSSVGLDPKKKTIMYAPTWNREASLLTWLPYILELPEKFNVNLIVKIHPGMYNDPSRQKSSGGVDWKVFLDDENLKKRGIINAYQTDSPDYIMASDITITDISTIWIEYYFLKKNTIFIDVPEFFKNHGMNSLGDFRDQHGYVVKNQEELNKNVEGILRGTIPKKQVYDLDNLLLFNKGHATKETIKKIKEIYEENK